MPIQQPIQMIQQDAPIDNSKSIDNIFKTIREGQTNRLQQEKLTKENALLDLKASPENQNRLKAESDAELQKKQNDAKSSAFDLQDKRWGVITDVYDYIKAMPFMLKDLEPVFGEEGAKALMLKVPMKTDISGQKQIPDNDAFMKNLYKMRTSMKNMKEGKNFDYDEDVVDEITGKTKTVTTQYAMNPETGQYEKHVSTKGGIKDAEEKAPKVENIQIGDKNVPSIWDPKQKKFVPIKGAGGEKWNPREEKPDKPDMTEPQARKEMFEMAKYEKQLADDYSLSDSEKAAQKKSIAEHRKYLNGFIKSGKKAEAPAGKTASKGSAVTHTYVPGKGLVIKGK